VVVANTVHEVDDTGKETTEGTSNRSGREEEGDTPRDLVAAVPLSEVEGDTGEETGLSGTEEDTSDKETLEVGDNTHKSHDNTPGDHDDRKPHGRTPGLHDHVGGNLAEDVEDEEDGEASGILGRVDVDVGGQTEEVGVTNVGTVEERKKVEKSEPGHNVEVTVDDVSRLRCGGEEAIRLHYLHLADELGSVDVLALEFRSRVGRRVVDQILGIVDLDVGKLFVVN